MLARVFGWLMLTVNIVINKLNLTATAPLGARETTVPRFASKVRNRFWSAQSSNFAETCRKNQVFTPY